jgi:hypothetical protein
MGCGVSANENSCAHHVTRSPKKLWRSNSIFNLCVHHRISALSSANALLCSALIRGKSLRMGGEIGGGGEGMEIGKLSSKQCSALQINMRIRS